MTSTRNEIIGSAIRAQRNVIGMKQGQLAAEMELSQSQLSKIERGKATLSLNRFMRLCLYLGTDPAFLLDGIHKNINRSNMGEGS